jgi:hypothetical protein
LKKRQNPKKQSLKRKIVKRKIVKRKSIQRKSIKRKSWGKGDMKPSASTITLVANKNTGSTSTLFAPDIPTAPSPPNVEPGTNKVELLGKERSQNARYQMSNLKKNFENKDDNQSKNTFSINFKKFLSPDENTAKNQENKSLKLYNNLKIEQGKSVLTGSSRTNKKNLK